VTLTNAVFWDVTPYVSCHDASEELVVSIITVNVVPSSLILSNPMVEATHCSETLVLTRATWCNIPEDGILHSHGHKNLKYYIALTGWVL
jgi:hypothetical protein